MQNNQFGRYFQDTAPQQPVYLFPQNRPGCQQSNKCAGESSEQACLPSQTDEHHGKHVHKRGRKRIFTLWNLFAVIGILTVIVQTVRYVIIPLLVYLNVLAGGSL